MSIMLHKSLVVAVLLLVSSWALFNSQTRAVNGDEGFYLIAAQMVSDGFTPYRDFFYPQMPYLPYLLAPVTRICETWSAARYVHTVPYIATCILVFAYLLSRNAMTALLGIILLATNTLFVTTHTIIKTHCVSSLFLTSATLLVILTFPCSHSHSTNARGHHTAVIISGMLVSLAIGTRLTVLLPALPLTVMVLLWKRWSSLLAFVAGCFIGAAPAIYLLISNPESFWFNNITYHSFRSDYGLIGNIKQKAGCVREFIDSPQYIILLVLALFGTTKLMRRESILLWAVIASIWLAGVLPTPVWHEYFSATVIFLVLLASVGANLLYKRCRLAAILMVCGYISLCMYDLRYDSVWRPPPHTQSLAHVKAVGAIVDMVASNREPIISNWPGYAYGTHARVFRGTENHFAEQVFRKCGKDVSLRFSIADYGAMEASICDKYPPVVIENTMSYSPLAWVDRTLYTCVYSENHTQVYVANNRLHLTRPMGRDGEP